MSPICPHVAEELWEGLGNKGFISLSAWPKTDSSKILQEKKKQLDLNSKVTDEATTLLQKVDGKKVYVYVVPFELTKVDAKKIEKAVGKPVSVYALNDAQKHDPAGKAKKARPGMPSVYVE